MVHQFKFKNCNIVLDASSGALHVVDDIAYDITELFEKTDEEEIIKIISKKYPSEPKEEIKECIGQIRALKENGKLFSEDNFEPYAGTLKQKTAGVVKALCLHVAHTCNLNCEYCFASQGKFHGERALMSFETGKRALDFLVENSGTRHNLEVDFFGGEPLMNFDVVKRLVKYARSIEKEKNKNFRFTLTTNGMLIDDDVIEFSNKHGVSPKEAYCALFGEKRAREAAEKSERKNSKIHALSQGGNAADDFADIPLNSDELWAAKKAGISPADYLKFKKRGNE